MGVIGHLGASAAPRIMKSGLSSVVKSFSFRCDAKQSEERYEHFDEWISGQPHFILGAKLPEPVVKGSQPIYTEGGTITVISTMSIQALSIDLSVCRLADKIDFGDSNVRRPRPKDVLVTVDGGTSIGKPVLFNLDGEFAVDSHVAILRPVDLDPDLLVHLLASPLGQLQFQRAESGASGQTSVTEDDIRRFRFPILDAAVEARAVGDVKAARADASALRARAIAREDQGWEEFLRESAPGL